MNKSSPKPGTVRNELHPGLVVDIVLKKDQPTGKLTRGKIKDILTNKAVHPHGIKVRLQNGQVGRVKAMISTNKKGMETKMDATNSGKHKKDAPKTDGSTAKFKQEKKEIKRLFKPFKNLKRAVKYKFSRDQHAKLVKELERKIKVHFEKYHDELKSCFENSSNPIIAFDVEEIYNEVFCVLAVRFEKDTSYTVYLDSSPGKPKPDRTKKAMNKLVRWIKGFGDHPTVLLHGFNKNEQSLVDDLNKTCTVANTQEELAKMIKDGNYHGIKRENLHDFQEVMDLETLACTFIKHARDHPELPKKDLARIWSPQAKIAVTRLATGKKVRNCIVCGKPQDPFLYCLEDSFTTLLVHAVFEAFSKKE